MHATAQENKAQLSVISWNINGLKEKLKDDRKKKQLLNIFGKYDIVLLQETHLGKKNKNKKKVAKATKLREEKLLERGLHLKNENKDEEAMKSEYKDNKMDLENYYKVENKDIIDSENEDEDEEEMKSEYEENSEDSEKQEEQNKDGIYSEDEDEDEEEMKSEYEENSEDSEKQEEQTDDGIDSENEDKEKVRIFFKKSGYIVEVLQNQRCIKPRTRVEHKIYLTKFCSKSRGVAILVNKQHICLQAFCEGGDYAWVYVEIDNKRYTFVSAYYHHKEKSNLMLRILCSFLTQEPTACEWPVIGGDFNTTLNYKLDKGSTKDNAKHKSRRKNILEIMETMKLKDVWREKHPNEKVYTFSCKKPVSRLDYVFMFQKHMPCVQNCDIWLDKDMVPKLSDHYSVRLTLTIKN